jgi:hypothetical protein
MNVIVMLVDVQENNGMEIEEWTVLSVIGIVWLIMGVGIGVHVHYNQMKQ